MKVFRAVLYKVSILRFSVLLTLTQILIKHQAKHRLIWANTLLLLLIRYIQTTVLIDCFFLACVAKEAE